MHTPGKALCLLIASFLLFCGPMAAQDMFGTWNNAKVQRPAKYKGPGDLGTDIWELSEVAPCDLVMRIKVLPDGSVATAEVAKGEVTKEERILLMIAAMNLSGFTPARQGGRLVPVWVTVKLSATAQDGEPYHTATPDRMRPDTPLEGSTASGTGETEAKDDRIYAIAEVMPSFPGGEGKLLQHISTHLQYPASCAEKGIEGVVVLRFVIEKDGSVGDVIVQKRLHPDCDRAAVRAVKSLPRFNPGLSQDKPVRVWFTYPVRFALR